MGVQPSRRRRAFECRRDSEPIKATRRRECELCTKLKRVITAGNAARSFVSLSAYFILVVDFDMRRPLHLIIHLVPNFHTFLPFTSAICQRRRRRGHFHHQPWLSILCLSTLCLLCTRLSCAEYHLYTESYGSS
jgi:hypothetical protein